MRLIRNILFGALLSMSCTCQSQEISWTSFEDLNDSLSVEMKPIMVFIHADWCKFCLMQEQTTFKDSTIIKELENYYCLKLNVNTEHPINFLGRDYGIRKVSENRYEHELARFLTDNPKDEISLPSTVFFDEQLSGKKVVNGVLKVSYRATTKK